MIPVNIEDMITKVIDRTKPVHHRQYFYDTIVKINKATQIAIEKYENEMNERNN